MIPYGPSYSYRKPEDGPATLVLYVSNMEPAEQTLTGRVAELTAEVLLWASRQRAEPIAEPDPLAESQAALESELDRLDTDIRLALEAIREVKEMLHDEDA